MKKILRLISSMKFAVILLLIIGVVSILGTLIQQNQVEAFYPQQYGGLWGNIILALSLDDAYRAWWFVLLAGVLLLSLFFCVVIRVKPIIKLIEAKNWPVAIEKGGSWILHVSLILIMITFGMSNFLAEEYIVFELPGHYRQVADEDLFLHVDDFRILTDENGLVRQYETDAHFTDSWNNPIQDGTISVNHPMTVNGIQFTQSSYSYGLEVEVFNNGESLGVGALYVGNFVTDQESGITVELVDLYPDYVDTAEGPTSKSFDMNNPYMLYRIYQNQSVLDMKLIPVGETIEVGDVRVESQNPVVYPILQARRDPYIPFVAASSALFMVGLLMVFLPPSKPKKPKKEDEINENTESDHMENINVEDVEIKERNNNDR